LLCRRALPYAMTSPRESLTYDDQMPRANFLFFSDSHVDFHLAEESLDNVRRTFDFASRSPIPLDGVIHAGDIITPFGIHSKADGLSRAAAFFEIAKTCRLPVLFSKGNHDLNDWDNTPEGVLTDRDWGELFLNYEQERFGIVRQRKANGERSTWHYRDFEDKRLRVIALDVQDTDKRVLTDEGTVAFHGGRSVNIGQEQMTWLSEVALSFEDKAEPDWGVIVVLHNTACSRPLPNENSVEKMLDLLDAFNRADRYTNEYKHPKFPYFDLSVNADFTKHAALEKRPHIVAVLLGHLHLDQNQKRKSLQLIWTLNNSASIDYGDARVVRIPGTSTQNSFDILNIDTHHRRIRLFRYGAGQNCYGVGGDRFLPHGLPY
jgi:DNA repair exonuclease SbcCD nuclease subunit